MPSWPLTRNIRAILSSYTVFCDFLILYVLAAKWSISAPFHCPEGNGIHITFIIHVHDGRPIARNGLLNERFIIRVQCETSIALLRRTGLRAGSAVLGFGFHIRIAIIVGILLPMNNGILRSIIWRPNSIQRQRLSKRAAESIGRTVHSLRPMIEGIARTGGGSGRSGRFIALHKYRRDIRTTLRIEGDPVALRNNRRQVDITISQRNGSNGLAVLILPTDNGFFIINRIGHVRRGNRIGICHFALLRNHDRTHGSIVIGRMEEDEVHVVKLGIIGNLLRIGHSHCVENGRLIIFIQPADEFLILAVRLRRAGVFQRFAILHNLARELSRTIHEDIGMRFHRRTNHRQHANRELLSRARIAAAGDDLRQRVHRQHADEHHYRHQQRDKFFELSHVLDPSALFLTFFKITPGDA